MRAITPGARQTGAISERQTSDIRLHTVYEPNPTSEGTQLVERGTIDAPRLLCRFVITQAKRAPEETLEKMKTLLEEREEYER